MTGALPRLGLVLVVRDEARLLADNLRFHRAMGVERVFCYLDRCRDETPSIARSFAFVEAIERDRREEERFMSSYQTLCMADAADRARAAGMQWLMHVDADEFARPERGRSLPAMIAKASRRRIARRGHGVRGLLRGVGRRVEQITLRTAEVVPTPLTPGQAFHDMPWFQVGPPLERAMLDPIDGSIRTLRQQLGGDKGKSVVRLDADLAPANAHWWTRRDGSPATTATAGLYHHYVVLDADHWLAKYRKFAEYPSHWEKGAKVRFPKQAWKEAATRMGDAEARDYFDRWVAMDPAELERLATTRAGRTLRRDTTVADVLAGVC